MGLSYRIMLDPDAGLGGGGGVQPADPAPAEPVLNSTEGLSPADLSAPIDRGGSAAEVAGAGVVDAGATPADPNLAGSQSAASIREAARYYGLDLSQFQDDGQAFAHLVQQAQAARQRNYYAELGQQVAPHYQAVQQYLQEHQARQATPQERPSWESPEFDERWLGLVDKDPNTGQYVARPGVNPAFAEKVQAYADHLDSWTTRLARSPMEALQPIIEHVAGQLLDSRFGAVQAQQEAQGIIQQNESWLYATDASGRRAVDQAGKFIPTPLGARYYTHLRTLQQGGVRDSLALDQIAKQLLQNDIYAAQFAQQSQGQQAASPQAVAAGFRPNVNPGQAVPPARRAIVPGATEPQTAGLSLQEMLRSALSEEGVSDADFAPGLNF